MKIVEKIAAVLLGTVLTTTVAWAQKVKHVGANGLSFAYVEEGSGPPPKMRPRGKKGKQVGPK